MGAFFAGPSSPLCAGSPSSPQEWVLAALSSLRDAGWQDCSPPGPSGAGAGAAIGFRKESPLYRALLYTGLIRIPDQAGSVAGNGLFSVVVAAALPKGSDQYRRSPPGGRTPPCICRRRRHGACCPGRESRPAGFPPSLAGCHYGGFQQQRCLGVAFLAPALKTGQPPAGTGTPLRGHHPGRAGGPSGASSAAGECGQPAGGRRVFCLSASFSRYTGFRAFREGSRLHLVSGLLTRRDSFIDCRRITGCSCARRCL